MLRGIFSPLAQSAGPVMVASDKLFFWLFQHRMERIQPFVTALPPNTFTAPVLKERQFSFSLARRPSGRRRGAPSWGLRSMM